MTRVPELLRSATTRLAAAGRPSPAADARVLLARVLDVPVARLLLVDAVDPEAERRFEELLARRCDGVPLQHLTGEAFFRTVRLEVGPGVFVPRPETEVMTGWALDRLRASGPDPIVVELCAGSGAISLALATELPGIRGYAVELSAEAAAYARRNLAGTGVELREGDMADAYPELDGTVDLVIANPPYIPLDAYESVTEEVRRYDPPLALFSGDDGLDAMRVVADVGARLLRPGSWLCAEHAEVQEHGAPELFVRHGAYARVRDERDFNDRPRFVTARRA